MKLKKALKMFENDMDIDIYSIIKEINLWN